MLKIQEKIIFRIAIIIFFGLTINILILRNTHAATFDANLNIHPSMTVTVPTSTVSLTLDPTSSPFATQDINITVGTNNKSGYWMTMSSSTGSSDLVNADDSTKTIPTLTTAGDYDSSSFEVNKWGYKVNNGNYTPFVSGNIIHQTNTTTNGETVKLTLGSKIDYLQSPGTYNIALDIKALPIMTTNYIQNLDPTLCTEDPMVVVDSRDEQAYTIQRLKDGKCWMMDNLNLGASALSVSQLDSTNTNITNGSTISASDWNSYKKTSGTSAWSTFEYIPITSANSTTGSDTDPTSKTKYGTLYNYCSASAGTVCNNTSSNNATSDICPAGWRLPTAGASGEFQNLYDQTAYNTNAKMRAPIKNGGAAFAVTGYFQDSVPAMQNGTASYWSSTIDNSTGARVLGINSTNAVSPNGTNVRYRGNAVRCVLKETMQEFSTIDAANMSVGDTKTLTDSRDGQTYTVAKLADNKIWMLDNLRLSSTSVGLTNENSNVAYTSSNPWYLPSSSSSGFNSYDAKMINTDYINTTTTSYGSGSGKIGVYYNYCAASAGTYCYASGSSTGNAQYDVCPKGWRMPTGGSSGEYQALYTAYSSDAANFRNALSTPLSGFFDISSAHNQGSYGYFWSSTRSDGNYMYYLGVNSSSVYPASNNYRYFGFSVRCIKN